jgi:hypothetical protein
MTSNESVAHDEPEGMSHEATVAYFKFLSRHSPEDSPPERPVGLGRSFAAY